MESNMRDAPTKPGICPLHPHAEIRELRGDEIRELNKEWGIQSIFFCANLSCDTIEFYRPEDPLSEARVFLDPLISVNLALQKLFECMADGNTRLMITSIRLRVFQEKISRACCY